MKGSTLYNIHTKIPLFFQGAKPSLVALLAHKRLLKVNIQEVVVRYVAPNGVCFEGELHPYTNTSQRSVWC